MRNGSLIRAQPERKTIVRAEIPTEATREAQNRLDMERISLKRFDTEMEWHSTNEE